MVAQTFGHGASSMAARAKIDVKNEPEGKGKRWLYGTTRTVFKRYTCQQTPFCSIKATARSVRSKAAVEGRCLPT